MKFLLFIFISVFMFFSCSKDDVVITKKKSEIVALWKLVKFEPGGFAPTNNYTGEIIWTFNSNNNVNVFIQSGTFVSGLLPLNSSSNYIYSTNNNQITLDSVTYNYEINNNVLEIEDLLGQSSDGKKMTFNKIQ